MAKRLENGPSVDAGVTVRGPPLARERGLAIADLHAMVSNQRMPSLLLTAFRPFDTWSENSSWLALQEFTRELPSEIEVTTRLYPVDYPELRSRLTMDLSTPYDVVLHLGQASGAAGLRLECFAQNAARQRGQTTDEIRALEPEGPAAYQSQLPLADWTRRLREAGVPAELSRDAGDYLCNAAMYWSHHLITAAGRVPRVAFIHVPLDISQAATQDPVPPSLPSAVSGLAIRLIASWILEASPAVTEIASHTISAREQV